VYLFIYLNPNFTNISRSESHIPEHGHGPSVDIWAVGMLALQLICGIQEIPKAQSLAFTSQDRIEEYLSFIFDPLSPLDKVSDHGKEFIRGCLMYDDEKRLTAHAALNHCWLQEPEADSQLFGNLERESTSSWAPRLIVLPVIEEIGQVSNIGNHQEETSQITHDTSTHFRNACNAFPSLETTSSSSRFFAPQGIEDRRQAADSQDGYAISGEVHSHIQREVSMTEDGPINEQIVPS